MKITRRGMLQSMAAATTVLSTPSIVRAQSLPVVRLAGAGPVPEDYQAYQFLGIPMGYYQKLGFTGTYIPTAGSSAALQLVLAGAADVANSGFLELISSKVKQPDLPVHMYYSQERSSSYIVVVPKDSPIKTVRDLAGKRIGVTSLGTGAIKFAESLLKSESIDPKTATFLPIGIGSQALAAIKGGQVDAISMFVGFIAGLESMGQVFREFTAPIAGAGMVMSDKFVKEKPDLAAKIYQGFVLNQRIMLTNAEAVTRAFWSAYGRPAGDKDVALKNSVHRISRTAGTFQKLEDPQPWGAYTDQEWSIITKLFGGEGGMIPEGAKLTDFYSPALVEAGNKVDLSLIPEAIQGFSK